MKSKFLVMAAASLVLASCGGGGDLSRNYQGCTGRADQS